MVIYERAPSKQDFSLGQHGLRKHPKTAERGCCIRSPLATKLFEVVLLHEDITQWDLKNSSHWYTCDLSPRRVSAMSVHYF